MRQVSYTPHQLIPGAAFRIMKAMRISGVDFKKGDELPADSPLRENAHRIAQMCRARHLEPILQPVLATPVARVTEQPFEKDDDEDEAIVATTPESRRRRKAQAV